jgi:hypothetical protein
MYDQKTMKDLTPKELGNYATNILACGCPLIVSIDYTSDPIKELGKLTRPECEEILRYANHLAKKDGFGENYFNPEEARKNLPTFTNKTLSDLEKKVTFGSPAAAA